MRKVVVRSAGGPAFFPRWGLGPVAAVLVSAGCSADTQHAGPFVLAATPEETGRYIVEIGSCDDCHTDGFVEVGFAVPESQRLTGSVVGFRGPWGTTFPQNLRLSAQNMTEDQWVEMLGTRAGLPPMPWPAVNRMSPDDRRAVYRYLRSLGPAGEPRSPSLPPGQEPPGPWIDFVPQNVIVTTAGP